MTWQGIVLSTLALGVCTLVSTGVLLGLAKLTSTMNRRSARSKRARLAELASALGLEPINDGFHAPLRGSISGHEVEVCWVQKPMPDVMQGPHGRRMEPFTVLRIRYLDVANSSWEPIETSLGLSSPDDPKAMIPPPPPLEGSVREALRELEHQRWQFAVGGGILQLGRMGLFDAAVMIRPVLDRGLAIAGELRDRS